VFGECKRADNLSPLQRLFGLYFILMAEKSKKVDPKLEPGKNRKLSVVTAKPLLLVV
jgi:hypothetical protein